MACQSGGGAVKNVISQRQCVMFLRRKTITLEYKIMWEITHRGKAEVGALVRLGEEAQPHLAAV